MLPSGKLAKLGEDVTETLEVIQTVREKFSCRECEKISHPPACDAARLCQAEPLDDDPVREVRPHQPLNRQSEHYAGEGIDLSLSTLADQIGACTAALKCGATILMTRRR